VEGREIIKPIICSAFVPGQVRTQLQLFVVMPDFTSVTVIILQHSGINIPDPNCHRQIAKRRGF